MTDRLNPSCPVCDGPLAPRARTGRPAVYCSRACQAKAYRARVATRRAGVTPSTTATKPTSAALPTDPAVGLAADRIDRLTVALVRRAEVAAGAVRIGRRLPDGSGGIDGRPDAIEQIARELVATIRGAAVEPETPRRDGALATTQPVRAVVPALSARRRAPAAVVAPHESAERVTRTVDMSHEFGAGYALVQLESSFDGEWLVRLHGETIGSVQRVASLSGHSVRGWEARHHGLKIPRMVRGDWSSRGLAMAAVVYAHAQHCLKARRRPRRRLQGA